jgi:hypothetical protein
MYTESHCSYITIRVAAIVVASAAARRVNQHIFCPVNLLFGMFLRRFVYWGKELFPSSGGNLKKNSVIKSFLYKLINDSQLQMLMTISKYPIMKQKLGPKEEIVL